APADPRDDLSRPAARTRRRPPSSDRRRVTRPARRTRGRSRLGPHHRHDGRVGRRAVGDRRAGARGDAAAGARLGAV
ncbi:MAG: hypothetical protein AVDCRST_MAG36-33, partial [uncultured Nocardioidaceae bacterium]